MWYKIAIVHARGLFLLKKKTKQQQKSEKIKRHTAVKHKTRFTLSRNRMNVMQNRNYLCPNAGLDSVSVEGSLKAIPDSTCLFG